MWAGLVRGVYKQVEKRIAYGKDGKWDEQDFKRKWRVRCAKKTLEELYGPFYIRLFAAYTVVVVLVLLAFIVVELTGTTHVFMAIYNSLKSSIDAAVWTIAGLVAAVAAVVPSFNLVFASNQKSRSRGEAIC